jgi:hypothetical protein
LNSLSFKKHYGQAPRSLRPPLQGSLTIKLRSHLVINGHVDPEFVTSRQCYCCIRIPVMSEANEFFDQFRLLIKSLCLRNASRAHAPPRNTNKNCQFFEN